MQLEILRKKLLYKANYRGSKENDILLSKFAANFIHSFDALELEEFEEILSMEDIDLGFLLTGRAIPQLVAANSVFSKLLDFYGVKVND